MIRVVSFLRWWGGELAALLPTSVRQALRRHEKLLRFEITSSDIVVSRRTNGRYAELGRKPRSGPKSHEYPLSSGTHQDGLSTAIQAVKLETTQVLVSLAPGLSLTKVLELPLATEENLPQVLTFEMHRQTPFPAESVYFDYQILDRNVKSRRLTLRLGVVPRKTIEEVWALVGNWDPQPAIPGQSFLKEWDGRTFCFLPNRSRRSHAAQLHMLLLVINLVLFGAAVAIPLRQQSAELERLQGHLEKAENAAKAVTVLQERADELVSEMQLVAETKERWPSVVEMLNEITVLLPDSTWLNRLEIKEGEVYLQGISDAASSLISRLEASPIFRDIRFQSPVTQDARSGRERFHLSAQIVPNRSKQ